MSGFVGRARELGLLARHLDWVRAGHADQRGRAILLRGRRRVGKSRLVDVFCRGAGVPYVVHQASKGQSPAIERDRFAEAVRRSDLPGRQLFGAVRPDSWEGALRLLAAALPADRPSIVVLDEFPWLMEQDPSAEGVLQTVWDLELSRKPVLLVIIGSDLAMMERLSDYERPFYQRGVEMVLPPLTPWDVMEMTGLSAAGAIDAYLITGGLPLICQEWRGGWSRQEFLKHCLDDPTSSLLVSGERMLYAEFPAALQPRRVLEAVGSGERTFSGIAARVGSDNTPMNPGTLSPVLRTLADKKIIAVDTPLSEKPGDKDRRYRVADPYLRFWLAFLEQGIPEVESGRGDRLLETVEGGWSSWRGRAVEPVVREALRRLLPDERWPKAREIGGWWPRTNNPEVDLIGADRSPARKLSFVGSIKWLERGAFGARDLAALARDAQVVPGADAGTPLIAVSRSGFAVDALAAAYGPEQLIESWRPRG